MVELLVTLLILSVVLLGLAALQITTIRQVTASRRANEATRLCSSFIERVRFIKYDSLATIVPNVSGSATDWFYFWNDRANRFMNGVGPDGIQDGPFHVEYHKEAVGTPPGWVISVRVKWKDVRPTAEKSDMTKKYQEFNVTMSCRRHQ
jgi:type II secretory pathway pseudopilin PulG